MSNPIRRLLGQTAVYGLSVIVGRTLNFLLVPLYTSDAVFPEPKDYGVVSELYAWVAFLIVLLPFGMETAFFKFFNDAKDDKERVYWNAFLVVIGVNALFFLGVLLFNQSIADWMLFSDHPEYIVLLGAIVCVDAVSAIPLARLRAENKALKFAGIQFSSIGVNIALNLLVLLVFLDGTNPEQAILAILVINLLASAVKPALLFRDFAQLRWNLDPVLVKQMIWYAFPLVIAGFAGIINETLDRVLLKQVLVGDGMTIDAAEAQVGIYSACYKLAMFVTIFLQAYRYAAEPFFFSQSKNEDRNKLYVKVMNYFVGAVCLVFLGVSLNIQIFKYFIPNEAYWEGLNVVPVLLLANVFLGIYYNQSIWYKLSGQTRFGAYIATGGALITIAMNLALIPLIGFYASAWATLVVYGAQMVASYLLGQKYYPIKYNLRKFFLYLLFALFLFGLAWLINIDEGWVQFFVHNALVLLFAALVYSMEKPTRKKLIV